MHRVYERGGKKAARWGDWKALQLNVNQSLDSPIEIYDLSKDPGEENNLAEVRPDLVTRAKEIFAEAHVPSPDWEFKNPKPKKKQ